MVLRKNLKTLSSSISIPEPIVEQYRVPSYPEPSSREKEVNQILTWLKSKGLVSPDLSYADLVE